jgi:hypothetical protein
VSLQKVQVKFVCGVNGCTAPLILKLLVGGEWSATCPGHFTTGEITHDIHRAEPGWEPEPV